MFYYMIIIFALMVVLITLFITMMGVNGLYSVLGANYRVLFTKYGMNLNNIMKVWNEICANEEEIIRKCEQVRELCEMSDKCVTSILNMEESYTIIEFLSTYYIFTYVFF